MSWQRVGERAFPNCRRLMISVDTRALQEPAAKAGYSNLGMFGFYVDSLSSRVAKRPTIPGFEIELAGKEILCFSVTFACSVASDRLGHRFSDHVGPEQIGFI